mgnify:CR=1 FL=1
MVQKWVRPIKNGVIAIRPIPCREKVLSQTKLMLCFKTEAGLSLVLRLNFRLNFCPDYRMRTHRAIINPFASRTTILRRRLVMQWRHQFGFSREF